MTVKKQIIELLKMYKQDKYTTNTFCSLLGELYLFEMSGRQYFEGTQRELMDELVHVTERYSSFEEDFKNYPGIYYNEIQVKNKFNEIYSRLNIMEQ